MDDTMSKNGNGRRQTPLIEAHQIGLTLDGAVILQDVSLALRPGEMVGLIGPNGAGKTTLLKILAGLMKPTAGVVTLEGRGMAAHSPREVARVTASVPQGAATDFAFTVREIVLMGRSPHLGRFELEGPRDRDIAQKAMRTMGIDALADRYVTTLSGGERQRVFIARALAQEPRALLLDEPTANLDVKHQLDVIGLVADLAHSVGLGVIAAIHDLDLAAEFCDRLVLLHQGRVLAEGAPEAALTAEYLAAAFEVQANLYRDPFTKAMRLSLARGEHSQ
jgi:iron complex transport system ATP-binding protein